MTSPLSGIDVGKRRQLAATLGLFATLFIAVGAVAATSATTALIQGFVAAALVIAVLLGLIAWGVLHSVKLDVAGRDLDAAIQEALRANGAAACGCGVAHDPDEMRFVEGEGQHVSGSRTAGADRGERAAVADCAHDGSGAACSHSCDTCVLAEMRPSPHRTRADRLRTR